VTRIIHYGDSMLTGDAITGAVRDLLQERFGDAGHGFVLAGRPWPWYMHRRVRHWGSNGWDVYRMTNNPLLDGCMGLGGVAFRSIRPGARFYVEPSDGGRVARFEMHYLAHPRGGRLRVQVNDDEPDVLDTRHDSIESRYHVVEVPDGQHRMTVQNAGGGQVRVFGVSMERPGPGVRYDSLGVNGLHASNFARVDEEHLAEQIRHRDPHLIVVMLGTNESANRTMSLERHGEDYTAMLRRLRAGAPEASCLVMSPPDRAMRTANGRPATYRIIPRIVARQREVAEAEGCAFFDTYETMGGEGSAARWRYRRPVLMGGDLTHPTDAGAEVIGRSLFESLMEGYERSRSGGGATPPADAGAGEATAAGASR
jgi:lysophospholipase L1-like esterase